MKAEDAIEFLAKHNKVLLLGGMAVILHGLSRTTKDIDIWLDPTPGIEPWAASIRMLLSESQGLAPFSVDAAVSWKKIPPDGIEQAATNDGMIRIAGADRPIDVFYWPNELELRDFLATWDRAQPIGHGLRLMEEVDLMVTKQATGRDHDEADLRYLSGLVEKKHKAILAGCDLSTAKKLFDRFATPEVAVFAYRQATDPDVRALGLQQLRELSALGDPFAADLLDQIENKAE